MALVCTAAAMIRCSHGGTATVVASQQRLKVDGQAVLVQADLTAATIAGCGNMGPSLSPCVRITSVLAGIALRLKAGGQGVVLDSATGITSSVPPGTFSVSNAGQTKLRAS